MSNPLFYGPVVVLDRNAHRDLHLTKPEGARYGFARAAHLIPALVEEFGAGSADLAVAFLPGPKRPSPVFVTGLLPNHSLMIDGEGNWMGAYVPAYLRRYPFIIGEPDVGAGDGAGAEGEAPQALLCIDEGYDGLGKEEGAALFAEDGSLTATTEAALALAEGYRRGALQTDRFCDKLQELDLLRPVTLDVQRGAQGTTTVHGLLTVDEAAFNTLSDEAFLELRQAGFLGPIYAHLLSLRMLERLSARLNAESAEAAA